MRIPPYNLWTPRAMLLLPAWALLFLAARAADVAAPGRATAGGPAEDANKPVFKLTPLPQAIHGGITVPTLVIRTESNRFTFLPPTAWRAQVIPEQKKILRMPPTGPGSITVWITESKSAKITPLNKEFVRNEFLSRHAGSQVTDEFPTSALGQPGFGFDLEWRSSIGARQADRCAAIPFPGGRLDATLTAPASEIASRHHDLNSLLLSFRKSSLDGRLEMRPVTPE